jgi:hypothetical protein
MIGELLLAGFISALGWMSANWTVDKLMSEKTETQICSEWKEELQSDGTIQRTRTCNPKK